RMVRREEGRAVVVVPSPAQRAEAALGPEQVAGGRRAQGDDHLGTDRLDLSLEERKAGAGLAGVGHAVPRRPALDHVRDVLLVAPEGHGAEDVVQELARRPHERLAPAVALGAGPPPHEEEAGAGVPPPEDGLRPPPAEPAARALADLVANRGEQRLARVALAGSSRGLRGRRQGLWRL